jgi:precorrin-3B C17-methyltransferase
VIVGYTQYIDSIRDLITDESDVVTTGMTKEVERCEIAVIHAAAGSRVALVSSGDPGIYGMAGLALEVCDSMKTEFPVEIVPGVSAANAVASRLGAPLMLDTAWISLSDLLVPWSLIERRIEAAAAADFVVALYNPRSRKRVAQLERTVTIFKRHRKGSTIVGIGTSVTTGCEKIIITDLDGLLEEEIGMHSTIIIGNSYSKRLGRWMVTPRGYRL